MSVSASPLRESSIIADPQLGLRLLAPNDLITVDIVIDWRIVLFALSAFITARVHQLNAVVILCVFGSSN